MAFGPEYLEGTEAFQIILASLGVLFVFSPVHNVLLAQNRLRVEARAMGVAAVVNAVLNLLWIPRFGIVGAAWATLVAELVILALSGAALGRPMVLALLRTVTAPLFAAGVMAGAMVLLGTGRSVLLTIPVGALVYGIALVGLGGMPEDARVAWRNVRERVLPRAGRR
jgi:O-antigen/teichoic acid export membrane protein